MLEKKFSPKKCPKMGQFVRFHANAKLFSFRNETRVKGAFTLLVQHRGSNVLFR
jgi:hypothetical protein